MTGPDLANRAALAIVLVVTIAAVVFGCSIVSLLFAERHPDLALLGVYAMLETALLALRINRWARVTFSA